MTTFILNGEYKISPITAVTDPEVMIRYYKDNENHFAPAMPKLAEDFYTTIFWQKRLEKFKAEQGAQALRFVLTVNDAVVGHVFIDNIIRGPFQAGYVGYAISSTHEGKRIISSSLKQISEYAFKEAKLNRLMANCMLSNIRSIRVLNTVGFNMEGIAKRYLKLNGQWEDHFLFSKLNPSADD